MMAQTLSHSPWERGLSSFLVWPHRNGQDYTKEQVAALPTFTVLPARLNQYTDESDIEFTLVLADAAALGDADPEGEQQRVSPVSLLHRRLIRASIPPGNYRHYLANDVEIEDVNSQDGSFSLDNGTVITSYAGPGPLQGSGTHRYAWLLLQQADNFRAPSGLASTTGPSHWNVSQYVSEANLTLVAASFFTVTASGAPTGSVVETSAVNTATLQVSSAAASNSAASSSAQSSSASRPSGSSAAPSSASPSASAPVSGAGKVVASAAIALLGALGIIALC